MSAATCEVPWSKILMRTASFVTVRVRAPVLAASACVCLGGDTAAAPVSVWSTSLQLITTPVLLLCSSSRRFSIYVRSRSVSLCRTVGEAICTVLVQTVRALYLRRRQRFFQILFSFASRRHTITLLRRLDYIVTI